MQSQPLSPNGSYDLKSALADFQKLKQQKSLPEKMLVKLQYLSCKILNQPILMQYCEQLPSYELQSLQQCNKQSQITLFVSIVKCLSGREVIVYFNNIKGYIKKDESFSLWKKCYISCDSKLLYIKKKVDKKVSDYEFKIKFIKVSKKFMEYKGKICFGIMSGNKRYIFGLEQQTTCQRIFKTLKQLVKENQPEKIKQPLSAIKNQLQSQHQRKNSEKFQSVVNMEPKKQGNSNSFYSCINPKSSPLQSQVETFSNVPGKSKFIMQFEEDESTPEIDLRQAKELSIIQAIKQELKRQKISNDTNYKLMKNLEFGRLLVYTGEEQSRSQKTKTSLIISLKQAKLSYAWILQQYISMKDWNIEIEESRILNKISNNSYKIYLQFRRYSIISLSRWVIATVTAIHVDKKVYLLIRSCEQPTEEEILLGNYVSTVMMKKWNQTVQICKKSDKNDKLLLTIITAADFGGYCSKDDNLNMNLQVVSKINNFYNFLIAQTLANDDEESNTPLFDFDQTQKSQLWISKCAGSAQSQVFSDTKISSDQSPVRKLSYTNSEISGQDFQQLFEDQQNNISFSKNKKPTEQRIEKNIGEFRELEEKIHQDFLKEFENFQTTERGTAKLVQFIQENIQEKYYLHHKFSQSTFYNPDAPKYNNDPGYDNWLLQKGKWRISGLELVFTNEEILAQQKNVLRLILKQLSSNVLAGKNIMNMSLPVQIFESKSFLQKLAQVYGLIPYYFSLASKQNNIVRQISYVAQALSYATTICPNIQKPFNPILGETYQCKIGGISLCFQQIAHHPPISAFYLKTQEYQCYGNHNPCVQMGLNTAIAKNINPIFVHFFQTNTKYVAYCQDFQIGGLIFGQRTYKNSGKVNVFEEKSEILCELSYGKVKKHVYESNKKLKTGQIIGGVYKVANSFTKRFSNAQWKNFDGIKYDQKIEELAKITGNWLGDFYVDNIKIRGIFDVPPAKPVKQTYVLPSDCSFRLDLYYKKTGDVKRSQQWKQIMENLQRKDKKLREQSSKQTSKKH